MTFFVLFYLFECIVFKKKLISTKLRTVKSFAFLNKDKVLFSYDRIGLPKV